MNRIQTLGELVDTRARPRYYSDPPVLDSPAVAGPLDSAPLALSVFTRADDAEPKSLTWPSWRAFVRELVTDGHRFIPLPPGLTDKEEAEVKKAQPLICPALFRPGGRRIASDARTVTLGVIDLDHLDQEKFLSVLAHLETDGIEYFLYTSWSHGRIAGEYAARLLIPFSHPVAAVEWGAFWPRMVAYVGASDPQCKDVNRAYFVPCCPTSRAAHADLRYREGHALDVEAISRMEGPAVIAPEPLAVTVVTREHMIALEKKLRKKESAVAPALTAVLKGEMWADEGSRDNVLFILAGFIAREFPQADPKSIARHFEQSVSHLPEPVAAGLSWVEQKIARHQERIVVEVQRQEDAAISARKSRIRQAFGTGRDAPYLPEEVDAFAARENCLREDFDRRWILQHGGCLWYYVAGEYVGPYLPQDSKVSVHTFLAPATGVGVVLEVPALTGQDVTRNPIDLMLEYGTIADRVVLDMMAQRTHYDARDRSIVGAPCPRRREVVPRFDATIARWLQILGGDHYADLEAWISWVTDLSRPCVALFLEGAPSSGKSLLAKGLARIWTKDNPTTLEQAMGAFNAPLARCPLVLADEIMPKDFRGRGRTGELREFLQQESRPYKQKYQADQTLKGAARVIVAANNRQIVEGEDHLTHNDVQAIIGRILHIEAPDEAAAFLAQTDTTHWVDGDRIAQHALWIVENTERDPNPPRFLIQPAPGALHRAMTTTSTDGSMVAHWIISWLLRPQVLRTGRLTGSSAWLIRVHKGQVHANVRALVENWEAYPTNIDKEKATAKRISAALNALSGAVGQRDARANLPVKGFAGRQKMHPIRTADLIQWAEDKGYADGPSIEEAILALGAVDDRPSP